MADTPLTEAQIANWRKTLVTLIGPGAQHMPTEQIQTYRDRLQGKLDELPENAILTQSRQRRSSGEMVAATYCEFTCDRCAFVLRKLGPNATYPQDWGKVCLYRDGHANGEYLDLCPACAVVVAEALQPPSSAKAPSAEGKE